MSHLPAAPSLDGGLGESLPSVFPCVAGELGEVAALHLPVAPRCNVQCVYCDRTSDCANRSPRGRISKLLTPQQAVAFAMEAIRTEPRIACAGVSGPGEPLANPEATLLALRLVRAELPELPFFIATNGIQLEDYVRELQNLGVSLVTVALNSLEPAAVARLVLWVRGPHGILIDDEAAEFIIARRVAGIEAAVRSGMTVRANVQLIPGINDSSVEELARRLRGLGVRYLHLRPFDPTRSPCDALAPLRSPSAAELERARSLVSRHLELVTHCNLCASDSIGCSAGAPVGAIRKAFERSSMQKDLPSEGQIPGGMDSNQVLAERAVALPQLQLIARVARWLACSEEDTARTLKQVLMWLDEQLGLRRAVITLADASGKELSAQLAHDVGQEQVQRTRYCLDEGITGQVFTSGKSVFLPLLGAEPGFLDRSGLRADLDLSALAFFCVPIRDHGAIIGTLSADKDNSQLKDADSDVNVLEEVAQLLAPFVQRRRLEESLQLYRKLRSGGGPSARLAGRSSTMDEVRLLIAKVAPATTTVLLTGETGTGKSAAAELIHELGPRATEPFIEINCGALPDSLIESELFGHEKGAFTGAIQRRQGVFERARGGTVFLDEVGELGPSAQTRLLRVLQTHRFERVGGSETLTTSARLIAATNRDLASAVASGEFRADLFYRLNVFPVCMPPLRERGKADIMLLADSFVDRHGRAMEKSIFRIDTLAIDMLTAYHWPGNVRELENVIERAVVLAEADVIHGHHLPPSLQLNRYSPAPERLDFSTRVASFEAELITEALKDSGGNQTKAAERLGITKRVIQYKIRSYGIPWERFLPKQ